MGRRMRFKKFRRKKRKPVIRRRTVGVKGVIEIFLRQEGWTDKIHESKIFEAWGSIVGTPIAAQSVPVSLSNGVLKVEVAHSLYATELSAMKTQILLELEKKLEDLNTGMRRPSKKRKVIDIQFRFNPHISKVKSTENAAKSDRDASKRVLKSVSPEVNDRIDAAVSEISDSELQASLKTLFLTQCSYSETTE